MKTITIISIAVGVIAIPFGSVNPRHLSNIIELNEHVKRKQNE